MSSDDHDANETIYRLGGPPTCEGGCGYYTAPVDPELLGHCIHPYAPPIIGMNPPPVDLIVGEQRMPWCPLIKRSTVKRDRDGDR